LGSPKQYTGCRPPKTKS